MNTHERTIHLWPVKPMTRHEAKSMTIEDIDAAGEIM